VYVFAVAMRGKPSKAAFHVPCLSANAAIEVIDEARTLTLDDGRFSDDFAGWGVHLYRIVDVGRP
jgi:hypothetical protein